MRIISRDEMLKLPAWTVYAKTGFSNSSVGSLYIRGENCLHGWNYTALGMLATTVKLSELDDEFDRSLIHGSELALDQNRQRKDATFDDGPFAVFTTDEVREMSNLLSEATHATD